MEIEVKQILFQMLNFGILFFVLVKFLFRPILDILEARSTRIAEGLAAAEHNLQETEKLEAKKAEEMAKAEKKATAIIAAAREESKKMSEDLLREAKAEAAKMRVKEEAEFVAKLSAIEGEMKSRMADLVVTTTKKVLSDSLSAGSIKEIAAKEIKKLK